MTSFKPVTQEVNFDNCARKLQKASCKIFHRKIYLTLFREFLYSSSWNFSKIFKTPLINLVQSLFQQRCCLQTVSLQLWCKGHFSKFLEESYFVRYRCTWQSLKKQVKNEEISPVTLLKGDSTTDALTAIKEFLKTSIRNICSGVSFQYSYLWLDA